MFFKELRYLGCCSDDRKDSIQRFSHEWKQKKDPWTAESYKLLSIK